MKVLIFLTIFIASSCAYKDSLYCSLCDNHVACGHPNTYLSTCPSDAKIVKLSEADKRLLVDLHNQYRNQVASGKLPGFDPAVAMRKMKWDNELETLAKLNVYSCKFDHDSCRNTKKFKFAGQNIFTAGSTEPLDYKEQLKIAVKEWFIEYQKASQYDISECCPNLSETGHFTQIVRDVSSFVGCAAITFRDGEWYKIIVTCDYEETNMSGSPVYVSGNTASKCKSKDKKYPALCNN